MKRETIETCVFLTPGDHITRLVHSSPFFKLLLSTPVDIESAIDQELELSELAHANRRRVPALRDETNLPTLFQMLLAYFNAVSDELLQATP